MFGNIKKNNVRGLGLKLRNDEYYDFMLYKGDCYSVPDASSCIVFGLDSKNINEDGTWPSSYVWGKATSNDIVLNNIGYTGTDNGLIFFRKDLLTNKELINVITGSSVTISSGPMIMKPVTGSTMRYDYPYEIGDGFVSLKGGFFQGTYKIAGKDYQILPNAVESDWNFEIVLRRRDYEVKEGTLSYKYPDNKGIFFYMGTRAENKFSVYYGVDEKEIIGDVGDDYFADGMPEFEDMCGGAYLSKTPNLGELRENPFESDYLGKDMTYTENVCGEDDYFSGDYFDKGCPDNGNAIDDEYMETDVEVDDEILKSFKTKEGYSISQQEHDAIITDNKFLLFSRTSTGYTVDTWDESIEKVKFVETKEKKSPNKFLLFNRTSTGYTVDTWGKYEPEDNRDDYDVLNDLKENAFAVMVGEDGSVGYKYAVGDCESESGYNVIVENSVPNLVKMNEWTTINVRVSISNPKEINCGTKTGDRKMKIWIYVNEKLVFISKELPEFRFRKLNDVDEKQEGVPYNISVGGGTQGLADGIWVKDLIVSEDYFPLMRDFGGSFIGDIKSFKFYDCLRDYNDIYTSVLA